MDIKLEKFEGPLDLLLQLIEQEELNITEVALSKVTEQYFAYLNKLEAGRSDELADFLVIAAKLVYLKSKNLLPFLRADEEDDGETLADQLKMYKRYVEAGKHLNELWSRELVAYERNEPPLKIREFILPINAGAESLRQSMLVLIRRLKPISPLQTATIDYSVTIKQKLDNILEMLGKGERFSFVSLLSDAKNKTEVIVSFLAILQLVQQRSAAIRQSGAFKELMIEKA